MMRIRIVSLAAVLALAAAPLLIPSLTAVQAREFGPRASSQQQTDKNKKPAQDEGAQDDQPLKLGTQLVTVPFNVTDRTNRYVNDLNKEDIEVLEDNKPQEVFSFERQTGLAITIAMLIDISGSEEYSLPMEKAAGRRFFERVLRPRKDLGAVVTFEGEATLIQGLTGDVAKLQRGLDEIRIAVPSASVRGVGGTPPINGDSRAGSTAIWDAVYSVSTDLLRREAGRRVVILITDGADTSSTVKMREAIERTWRSEVIVYAIGIGDPAFGVETGDLKKITAETGGRAFFPRNEEDLDKAFNQIDEDLRSQYVLAYTPANGAKDGSFRTIQLKVKNRKELNVRHRRGYFAPKPA
ncbi:MAG TPA: VWA domain-containing protein [Blastocatellia bacterium]|nr:VWA domain-containing protein [Blastocatellia bacterium]